MAGFNIRPQITVTLDPFESAYLLRILETVGKGEPVDRTMQAIAAIFAGDMRDVMESISTQLEWIEKGDS